MANDSKIVITAGLQIPETIHNIQDELNREVAPNLSLEISCVIKDNSLKAIQEQISSISKTLDISVDAQNIQQSISNATRNQQVRVNVTTEINKGELIRQAKEIEKTLGIVYPKGQTEALRTELKGLLSEYQKAFDTSGYSKEAENQMSKILQFALSHKQEEQLVNEELKHQQERIKEIQREQQKVFITAKQYAALQKEAEAQGTNAKVMLDRMLGGSTGWTTNINKVSNPNKPYYWSDFAHEVNSINPLKDAIVNEGDIVQGVRDLADIFSKSFTQIDDSIEKNKAELNNWAIFLMETVGKVTGRSPFADSAWIDIGTDEIKQTEQNVQALAKGMQTIAALKESIKSSDPNGVQSVTADWTQDAERNLNGFVLNVHKATGEVERLHYALDETGESFERIQITGSDSGVERMLVKATQAANNLERKMINLKAAADDQSAPRSITSEESIGKVTEAYNKATSAIEKLRTADATTFIELDNEARKAVDELNNVIKTARNADTAATKLRAKPIETIKAEETAGLSELSTTISNSVIPNVENLTSRIETLRSELSEVKDKQGLTDYLNKLTELEADFKAIETQAKAVKRAISDLDKVSGSTQFKNNASNPDVVSQMSNISALRDEYTQLLNSLGQAKSPEAIQVISNKLAELKPRFDAVISSSNALSNTLKNDDAAAKFGAKLDALRNRMEAFANANQKAIESTRKMRSGNTFAEEWQNMLAQLNNPNIDANGLQRLTEQFRNFTGEARTAGTVTSHLFDNMGNQIKMLASRWLSLYAIVGKIRTMIDYVTQLDAAMTKLKRVTDETAKGYEEFLETAKRSAKETNTTLVDTVEQASKWAKAGFSAAESAELAKTSLIYSIVGDIDNDTAVSDLVTALKGFRLEAEDAMSVVDKLDALNNKYATDAKSLGEGLRVSASAMAAANNDLDQTLALLTGATEITQNAQETGQAIKTITMRLRGKFYASIWGNSYATK